MNLMQELLQHKNFEVTDYEIPPQRVSDMKKKFDDRDLSLDMFFEQEIESLNEAIRLAIQVGEDEYCLNALFSGFPKISLVHEKTLQQDYEFQVGSRLYRPHFENLVRMQIMGEKIIATIRHIRGLYYNYEQYIDKFRLLESEFNHITCLRIEPLRPLVKITMPSPDLELRQVSYTIPVSSYYYEILRENLVRLKTHANELSRLNK